MTTYAFVSHESAVEANWAIARHQIPLLDDEGVWLIPAPNYCVCTQRDVARLARTVDLSSLGISASPIHPLCPSASSRSRGSFATFHVWKDFFPDHAFLRVHERIFVSSPLFTVVQLAVASRPSQRTKQQAVETVQAERLVRQNVGLQQPYFTEEDLLTWKGIEQLAYAIKTLTDFAGTYRLPSQSGEETLYQQMPLVSFESLLEYLHSQPRMHGSQKARKAVSMAFERSASPMETALALMLTLPVEMGGFGLPKPILNRQVFIEPEHRELTAANELFGDLTWEDSKVITEYDSYEKHESRGPLQLANDRECANSLTALGWHVLTVSDEHVSDLRRLSRLAAQLSRLLGVGLTSPSELEMVWRTRLHALIIGKTDHLH